MSRWEIIKNFIIFFNNNLLGIIFLIFSLSFIIITILNYINLIIYKGEYRSNDKKFITKRCKEDGNNSGRNHVYLINKENKTYQRIADRYTLNQLGYGSASREEYDCFSILDYKIKNRIKIYNILFDIRSILKLKDLKDDS